MSVTRPFVLSIAGLDPSAGAGLLADARCFEQHQVYGFGVCTAITMQSDREFIGLQWTDTSRIIGQLEPLVRKFNISAAKIGLIRDVSSLSEVLVYLRKWQPDVKIVLDPILKASAGFNFHNQTHTAPEIFKALKQLNLITPNFEEAQACSGRQDVMDFCQRLASHTPVLLKGGHHPEHPGTDYLFEKDIRQELRPETTEIHQKHGSGCVLSAAITAQLALGNHLLKSCRLAKQYTENFLNSNTSLLGYHSTSDYS